MLKDLKILITDDDDDDREFISDAFISKGYQDNITEFRDGLQLMNYLRSTEDLRNHLVLLDLNMPIKDGYDTLAEIKSDPVLQSVQVVILTTSSSSADQCRCKTLGCDDYLIKPMSYKEYEIIAEKLITAVSRHLV